MNPARRILVVDDDLFMRDLILGILVHSGYQDIDSVCDGVEAWTALNESCYYLVITDHKMPGLTGLELIKKMRSEDMLQPVILVSGTIPTEELSRHPGMLVDAVLSKPFMASELLATVNKVLRNTDNVPVFSDTHIPEISSRDIIPIRARKNSSCRVLVVDDDQELRQFSVDVLTTSGYFVEGVGDGAAGWEALQTHEYDLVITDNHMPRMTGLEMIEKLRSVRMRVLVVMATGYLPAEEFARRPWLRPDAMLERPFTDEDLLTTVRKVLGTDINEDDVPWTLPPKFR
jgi:CheY-like chemotaxis protein